MFRLALILWAVVAPTLAGSCVLIVLIAPNLAANDSQLILPAALLGCITAAPISYLIAKRIAPVLSKK